MKITYAIPLTDEQAVFLTKLLEYDGGYLPRLGWPWMHETKETIAARDELLKNIYGIIATVEYETKSEIKEYFIPESNIPHVKRLKLPGNSFVKEVGEGNIPVLELIYNNSNKLKDVPDSWKERIFTTEYVSSALGIPKSEAFSSMQDLEGLLHFRICTDGMVRSSFPEYCWSIPQKNIPLVEEILFSEAKKEAIEPETVLCVA